MIVIGSLGVAAFSIQTNAQSIFGCVTVSVGPTVLMLANMIQGEGDKSNLKSLFTMAIKNGLSVVLVISIGLFIGAP